MSSKSGGFTHDPIPTVLVRTALPIVFITSVNGVLTVVDAALLGLFAGPDALAAVTVMFPVTMALIALSTMVSSGMASILARQLGAGSLNEARATYAGAHGLVAALSVLVLALFAIAGPAFVGSVADGSERLAAIGYQFLAITTLSSPLLFLVALQSDALRAEGRAGFMALAGLVVSLGNIAFNVALIWGFGLGVAGSAIGTAAAQGVALLVIVVYRRRVATPLGLSERPSRRWLAGWWPMLALGAPRSLNFLGIALGAVAVIAALRLNVVAGGETLIAAYGIVMRIMTFAYLPLLGLSLAMQAVVGNNAGAGLRDRASAALRLAVIVSAICGAAVELILLLARDSVGAVFVGDPEVVTAVAGILPYYVALYVTLGPMMMIASYFQAIGGARRAAILSLARTYLFAIPLTFALPLFLGGPGIWLAMTAADALLVVTTLLVVAGHRRSSIRVAPAT